MVAIERFKTRIIYRPGSSCWHYCGVITEDGYGYFHANKIHTYAHRFSYEHYVGPIPAGMTLDHLCRVRHCVNPDHLEPVTHRENILRGVGWSAVNARKTHCPQGHRYSAWNTHITKEGWRRCRICFGQYQHTYQPEYQRAYRGKHTKCNK